MVAAVCLYEPVGSRQVPADRRQPSLYARAKVLMNLDLAAMRTLHWGAKEAVGASEPSASSPALCKRLAGQPSDEAPSTSHNIQARHDNVSDD